MRHILLTVLALVLTASAHPFSVQVLNDRLSPETQASSLTSTGGFEWYVHREETTPSQRAWDENNTIRIKLTDRVGYDPTLRFAVYTAVASPSGNNGSGAAIVRGSNSGLLPCQVSAILLSGEIPSTSVNGAPSYAVWGNHIGGPLDLKNLQLATTKPVRISVKYTHSPFTLLGVAPFSEASGIAVGPGFLWSGSVETRYQYINNNLFIGSSYAELELVLDYSHGSLTRSTVGGSVVAADLVTISGFGGLLQDRTAFLRVSSPSEVEEVVVLHEDEQSHDGYTSYESGSFTVTVGADRCKSVTLENVPIIGSVLVLPQVTLKNGDINRDESIDVFDYDRLSTDYDKSIDSADWDVRDELGCRPSDCDLDGDGAVTVFDLDILSLNFD